MTKEKIIYKTIPWWVGFLVGMGFGSALFRLLYYLGVIN